MQKSDDVRYIHGMEDHFKLAMTRSSVARGGEMKFNMVDDWRWDCRYQALDTMWVDCKVQKEKCSCARVNDAQSCFPDFYLAISQQ